MTLGQRVIRTLFPALITVFAIPVIAWADGTTTIKDTVQRTLNYNPTIKAFQEYRQAAEHDLRRARSDWFPRLDLRAGYGAERWNDQVTRRSSSKQDTTTFYDRSTVNATLSQIIWDGMATWNRVTLSEQRLDSAHSRLFDNAEALSLDAILAHIEIYRQTRLLALANLNVRNHERILGSQYERQRSGASTMADVTQTQSRLTRTKATRTETQSALEVATANYQRLTGQLPTDIETPAIPREAYGSLEDAITNAQAGNFKIKALETDFEASKTQIELDKAPFHPTVTLDLAQDYQWRVQSADTHAYGTSLMLNVNWNLFRGGYDWYNVKGDRARSRQAQNELLSQKDMVTEEVSATWSQLISAREQVKFFTDGVKYATRTRDMYLEQFDVGQRSLLDVLDSENEVYTASIQLVTAQQNVIAAQYRLLALGGDLLPIFDLDRTAIAINTDRTAPKP